MRYTKVMTLLFVILLSMLSACATVGPKITSEQEREAQATLKAAAKLWQKRQKQRILEIAVSLL